jgi:hypothetical protein
LIEAKEVEDATAEQKKKLKGKKSSKVVPSSKPATSDKKTLIKKIVKK